MVNNNRPFKIIVDCERDVAYDSPDHLFPRGAKNNNSRNMHFNKKLYKLYVEKYEAGQLKILDLGCSGGGFVKDCIDGGCLAVGLEGSDYSKKYGRAEWRTIPQYLFTCDISRNFDIYFKKNSRKERLLFDVVTAWEVMEHISESDLARLAINVKKHLACEGIWVMSISPNEEVNLGVRLHQTVHGRQWWINKFASLGFVHQEKYLKYFNTQFVDTHFFNHLGSGEADSFHLVLTLNESKALKIPKLGLFQYFLDRWVGSMPQRVLRKIVLGD